MHHTNKNRRGLAGSTAVSKQFKHINYALMACTCQGRMTCKACTHFAAIGMAGAGYRAWWPRARSLALVLALAAALTSGTMAATPDRGRCLKNTLRLEAQTPALNGVSSCLDSRTGYAPRAAMPEGFGQGAPIRKDGGVTSLTFFTPCPPDALKNANGGFFTRLGA